MSGYWNGFQAKLFCLVCLASYFAAKCWLTVKKNFTWIKFNWRKNNQGEAMFGYTVRSPDRRFPKFSLKVSLQLNWLTFFRSIPFTWGYCLLQTAEPPKKRQIQNPRVASFHWCVPTFMLGCPLKHSPIWIIGMTGDAHLPSLLPQEAFTSWLGCLMLPQLSVSIDSPQTVQNTQKEKLHENTSNLSRNKILHHLFSEAKTKFTSERSKCYTELLNVVVIRR